MITVPTNDRYERLRDIPTLNFDKVRNARMLVIGAGAVGNEVIKNLSLFGVGKILIVDFDNVEKSNLTRAVLFRQKDTLRKTYKSFIAAKRAKELNPDCDIHARNADICYGIGLGLFRRMDAVICCVDSRFGRLMINRFCYWLNKPWINCGILDAEGICTVYKPGVNDYESELSELAWKNISLRFGCPDVARHMIKEGSIPTTPVSASIIGAMQVSEAMKILHGYDDQLLAGLEFRFDLRRNEFMLIECKDIDEYSESNRRIENIHETDLSNASTVKKLRTAIEKLTGESDYEIHLRDAIVTEVVRESDGTHFKLMVQESCLAKYLDDNELRDVTVDNSLNRIFISSKITMIKRNDRHLDKYRLKKLGIPELDIIEVRTENKGTLWIELTADSTKYNL